MNNITKNPKIIRLFNVVAIMFWIAFLSACSKEDKIVLDKPAIIKIPTLSMSIKLTKIFSTQNEQKMITSLRRKEPDWIWRPEYKKVHPENDYFFYLIDMEVINEGNQEIEFNSEKLNFKTLGGDDIGVAYYEELGGDGFTPGAGYMTGDVKFKVRPNSRKTKRLLTTPLLKSEKGMQVQYVESPPLLLNFIQDSGF